MEVSPHNVQFKSFANGFAILLQVTTSRHTLVAYPHKHIVGFSIIRSGR
jgi:hypothetical protein